ncbi:hypothetical protein BSK52_03790 [Paenibacillus odorifer]|uniref:Tyr recombinase domain-containing protein n=2 Tax=Paenibacillus odorifer TaxID=189426 RepID=A0A1R0Y848_9BACL|nr:hypothetical protein BSK52_03790 [Paenibacillus odorifer]
MRSKINAKEQMEMQYWNIEEFNQFLNSSKYHVHYIVFSLAIYTGMRRVTEGMEVLIRKAGVKKIRFHDQRHTNASFLLAIGINPKVTAERLGMTPAMFNERYSHLLPIMQEEAVDKIEAELNKYAERQLETAEK